MRPLLLQPLLARRSAGTREVELQRDGLGQIQAWLPRLSRLHWPSGKQTHHRIAAHTRSLAAHTQAVLVGQLFHIKPVRALHDDQARRTPRRCIARANDRVAAAIQYRNQAHVALAQGSHLAPARCVQHVAANVRQAGQHHHHVQRSVVGLQARFGILALAWRAVETGLHLAVAAADRLDQLGGDQLIEPHAVKLIVRASCLCGFCLGACRRCRIKQARVGHLRGGLHHRSVHRHGRYRACRYTVQGGFLIVKHALGFGRQHLDLMGNAEVDVLRRKVGQQLVARGFLEDRLVVAQQAHVQKLARRIHHHQDVDGLAAVARHGLDVDGFEYVGIQRVAAFCRLIFVKDRPHRQRGELLADVDRVSQLLLQLCAGERACISGVGQYRNKAHGKQRCDKGPLAQRLNPQEQIHVENDSDR